MTYETVLALIDKTSKVKVTDIQQVLDKLYYQASLEDDAIEYFYNINDLTELILKQELFEGDEDDFHNLSVTYARGDDYANACDILDKGLNYYPYSIDLLADYLNYGIHCNRFKRCEELYKKLLEVRKWWNWRAYQFSINYLIKRLSIDPASNIDDIEELVEEFVEKMPDIEECYITKAEYIKTFKSETNKKDFLAVLEYAVSQECIIQRTPKCDLKLADYYYNLGNDLSKANDLLERCKRNSVESQLSVNRKYVYLLSALCKICLFYDNLKQKGDVKICEGSEEERRVLSIYNDYHVAAAGSNDSQVRNCRDLIEAFIKETGISYPYDDGIYNDQ